MVNGTVGKKWRDARGGAVGVGGGGGGADAGRGEEGVEKGGAYAIMNRERE